MRRSRALFAGAVIGLLAPIAPVYAGGGVPGGGVGGGSAPAPSAGGAGFTGNIMVQVGAATPAGHNYAPLDYYPRATTVHQGDVVTFRWAADPNALHTVTFVPAGTAVTDRAVNRIFPGGGGPIPDKDDGKGALYFPFNFFQAKGCGNSAYFPATPACSYTGKSVANSGLQVPAADQKTGALIPGVPLPSYSVRLDVAPGTYRYFCLVHGPAMSGSITVVPTAAKVTTAADATKAYVNQYRSQNTNAVASEAKIKSGPAGPTGFVVQAGSQSGRIEMDQFYPATANVKAGDTVTFTPGGFHTVSFQPKAPALALGCEAPGHDAPFTGRLAGCDLEVGLGLGAIPSGPSGQSYAGGYLNSGILVVPRPHAFSATFTKPGVYHYVCLVHARMFGTIVVH